MPRTKPNYKLYRGFIARNHSRIDYQQFVNGTPSSVVDTRMQRRIKAQPQETAAYQALIDHKQATLNVLLSRIPDVSTFAQLGELMGYSHEWVRQRLIQAP